MPRYRLQTEDGSIHEILAPNLMTVLATTIYIEGPDRVEAIMATADMITMISSEH